MEWFVPYRLLTLLIYKMSVIEMKILRWISENIHKDGIQNEEIHLKLGVALIDERQMFEMVWSCSKEID